MFHIFLHCIKKLPGGIYVWLTLDVTTIVHLTLCPFVNVLKIGDERKWPKELINFIPISSQPTSCFSSLIFLLSQFLFTIIISQRHLVEKVCMLTHFYHKMSTQMLIGKTLKCLECSWYSHQVGCHISWEDLQTSCKYLSVCFFLLLHV